MGLIDNLLDGVPTGSAAVRTAGTRQDTWVLHLQYEGNSFGVWDKKTGGGLDSEETKYYAGNMEDPQQLGGRVNPGNVVLQRLFDRIDDMGKIDALYAGVGFGVVTVTQRPLDQHGAANNSKRIVFKGVLKSVKEPDVDSEGTGAALFEIELSVIGRPTVQ